MQFRTAWMPVETARTARQLPRPCTVSVLLYSRLAYHAKGARAEALIREAVGFSPAAPRLEPLIQDLIQ